MVAFWVMVAVNCIMGIVITIDAINKSSWDYNDLEDRTRMGITLLFGVFGFVILNIVEVLDQNKET